MKNKYNLALTPVSKTADFIKCSQQFSAIADKYLLGKNSLPHITLHKFSVDEVLVEDVWQTVCDVWKEKPINLEFVTLNCTTFDKIIYWVSLMPNHRDVLFKLNGMLADVIKQPMKRAFDPHLTLVNTKNKAYEQDVNKFSNQFSSITDTFVLSLGKSDEVGQLAEVIHIYSQ